MQPDPDVTIDHSPQAVVGKQWSPEGQPADRYLLQAEIARGGMGAVYRGVDLQLQRELAIKLLLDEHRDNAELARRFWDEARLHSQLQHPGIAPLYDAGELRDGRPFFAMKLVAGQTLASLLKQRSDPSSDLPQLLKIFEQISQTVAYAHSQGIIHRDLKPQNVMVGAFGEVQVMDWGLARWLRKDSSDNANVTTAASSFAPRHVSQSGDTARTSPLATDAKRLTQAGAIIGTPSYMPPEQARGEVDALDERADVFGLGAILLEILTGQPPYPPQEGDVLARAQRGDLTAAVTRMGAEQIEPALSELSRRCLSADPGARPRDASVVARSITDYLASVQDRLRAAEIERAKMLVQAAEQRKRRRVSIALAAALLLLGAAGVGIWRWRVYEIAQDQAERQHRQAEREQSIMLGMAKVEPLRAQALASPFDTPDQAAATVQLLTQALDSVQKAQDELAGETVSSTVEQHVRETGQQIEAEFQEARRDQQFLLDLEAARILSAAVRPGHSWTVGELVLRRTIYKAVGQGEVAQPHNVTAALAKAFEDWECDVASGDVEKFARRLEQKSKRMHAHIAEGLELWEWHARGTESEILQKIADRIDPNPWRTQLRAVLATRDREALDSLTKGAESESLNPETTVLLALALIDIGNSLQGLDLLEDLSERKPGNLAVHLALATLGSQASTSFDIMRLHTIDTPEGKKEVRVPEPPVVKQSPPDQVRHLTAALALRPDNAALHYRLGCALLERAKQEESEHVPENDIDEATKAILHFEEARRLDPRNLEASTLLGFAREKKSLLSATEAYRDTARAFPDKPGPAVNLGYILARRGQWLEAETEFRRAVQLDPKSLTAHYNLGLVLELTGRPGEALLAYEAATWKNELALRAAGKFQEAHDRLVALKQEREKEPGQADSLKAIEQGLDRFKRLLEYDREVAAGRQFEPLPEAGKCAEYAEVCFWRAQYASAARLWQAALDAAPNGNDFSRYFDAVCAASLASSTASAPEEAASWRRQALDWLRTDLEALSNHVAQQRPQQQPPDVMRMRSERKQPGSLEHVLQHLGRWRAHVHLAPLREVEKMPVEERADWEKFWSDVAALAIKADTPAGWPRGWTIPSDDATGAKAPGLAVDRIAALWQRSSGRSAVKGWMAIFSMDGSPGGLYSPA